MNAVSEKDEGGSTVPSSSSTSGPQQSGGTKFKSYKLLLDPILVKGAAKLYRFDGVVPDDPTYPPVTLRDPRNVISFPRNWSRQEGLELPIPRFKIDANYIGKPPPVEVSITNLNDNVDKPFLCDLLQKHGTLEEVYIYYHPQTNKHLGLARIIFDTPTAAKSCVSKLHNTPVMGNVLNVFLDPFGEKCKALYDEVITDKPPPIPKKIEEKKITTEAEPKGKTGYSKQAIPNSTQAHSLPSSQQHPAQTPSQQPVQITNQYQMPNANHYPLNTPAQYSIQTAGQYPGQYSIQTPGQPSLHVSSTLPYPIQPPIQMTSGSVPPSPQAATTQALSIVDGEVDVVELENRSPKMDLDTRIKMLLKSSNKSTAFGKLIGFDLGDSSSDDGEEAHVKFRKGFTIRKRKSLCISRSEIWNSDSDDDASSPWKRKRGSRDASVSPPPSPFLARGDKENGRVRNRSKHLLQSDLDEVSDDSGVEESKIARSAKRAADDLSHTESLQEMPYSVPSLPFQVPVDHYYPQDPNYAQQIPGNPYGTYPPQPFGSVYLQQSQWSEQQTYQQPIEYSQVPYYGHSYSNNVYPEGQPQDPIEVENPMSPASELRANTERILKGVFDRLLKELRLILRRDTEKKLIESWSFKIYEEWFAERLKFYKEMKENRGKENRQKEEDKLNGKLEMSITEGSLLGMGFRANIPKLPSFKIHKKPQEPAAPATESQTADKSADEADSDTEIRRKPRPPRRLSLSSSASAETSSSSESEDSESEEDSSLSEDDVDDERRRNEAAKSKDISKVRDIIGSISDDELFVLPRSPNREISKKQKETAVFKVEPIIKTESPIEDEEIPATRLPSPERVSPEGPYVHLHDHSYANSPENDPTPKIPEPPVEKIKVEAVKLVLKPKAQRPKIPPKLPEVIKYKKSVFRKRDLDEDRAILTEFLSAGVDAEDIAYFRKCFETMVVDPEQNWVGRTHWVDHPVTRFPERKKKPNRRIHVSGAARTEGFYKLTAEEKRRHKLQWATVTRAEYKTPGTAGAVGVTVLAHQERNQGKSQIEKSREARSQQRRILTALGSEVTSTSDLLKFNQLKFRKKSLRFQRSIIHDWGLFAAEPIAADEMVIEYVGQTIRPNLADYRERKYESIGIGSSYLFRVDLEKIVDATKCGNLSRFINHSCNPNCYAKVISIEGEKKIVIYSKQAIAVSEEITYDYKFPYEEKKILCLCGTPQCRGTLN